MNSGFAVESGREERELVDQNLEQDFEALRSSGNINEDLELYIERTLETGETHPLPAEDESPLQIIGEDFSKSEDTEDEEVFYADESSFVCSAEPGSGDEDKGWNNGLKGHDVRNIGVYSEHGKVPLPEDLETQFGDYNMVEVLREVTAEQVEDGYVVLYGSMSSIEDHFHLVASDLGVGSGIESDLEDVSSYFLYRVEEEGEIEFLEGRISESFGKYIQELIEEDDERIDFRKA